MDMEKGTWEDAENKCRSNWRGSHLWSINSYSEWWHIVQTLGMGVSHQEHDAINLETMHVMTSVITFIGLKTTHGVNICYSIRMSFNYLIK